VFGTDYFGQDVLSRFLHGGRSILVLAALSTALALVAGTAIGLVAAYNRGRLDDVLMRIMDVNLAFPQLLLALVALTTIGPRGWLIVLVVGITTMPRIARITRGAAVPVVERDFVAAAEALGEPRWRILLSELLPNVSGPLLVEANLRLTYSIGIIASLGFLGFATEVNAADWGLMVNENRIALSVQPWGTVLPSAAIAVLTVATGLIADGLARATAGIDRAKGDR
jgi:peptide/nickel transport system permease protein